ncbi:unnamed protein product, partial [Vitis vinifera]|uniref:Uncharacterized protein n=1 Tax=Vitis vinifera TaxID=29760 RepID=D7U6E1_VITVI
MLTEEIRVRLLFYGKYALYCHSPKLNLESDFMGMIMFSKFKTNLSYLQLWLLLSTGGAFLDGRDPPIIQQNVQIICCCN